MTLPDLSPRDEKTDSSPEEGALVPARRRLYVVGGAQDNLRFSIGRTSTAKETPEAYTVSNNQPKQTESKFIPEDVEVIDYPVHFELEEMANEARENIDRIFEEAA